MSNIILLISARGSWGALLLVCVGVSSFCVFIESDKTDLRMGVGSGEQRGIASQNFHTWYRYSK